MTDHASHRPRAIALAYCEKCGNSYTLSPEDTLLLPTMHLPPPGGRSLEAGSMRLWVHWIEHIASHCPNCRLPRPPVRCLRDLERHEKRNRTLEESTE